ncbi:uncharacterized protein [Drosophila suzukii]|uniref:Uncharacterized protein n=1 Tax=Drosophila suzukii TaxID=28584 RepID=A0ABM4TWR3_DROSZ
MMNPKYPTCSVLRKSWISSASHPSIQRRGCEDAVGLPSRLPYTTFEPNYIIQMASVDTDIVAFQVSVPASFQGLSLNSMTPNRSILSTSANSSCCFAGDTGKNLSLTSTAPSTNWIECSTMLLSLFGG